MVHEKPNLVPAIREIEAVIHAQEVDFEARMKPYRESLAALRQINGACETCCGSGKRLRPRVCAEDDRPDPDNPSDWIKCPDCHGTGRVSDKAGEQR